MSQAPEKYLSSGDGPGNPDFPSKTQSGLAAGQTTTCCLQGQPLMAFPHCKGTFWWEKMAPSPAVPPAAKATGSAKVGTGWC